MNKTARTGTGRYFWFDCSCCKWRAIRYSNVKVCPRCGADVHRGKAASEKERDTQLENAMKKWNTIPE